MAQYQTALGLVPCVVTAFDHDAWCQSWLSVSLDFPLPVKALKWLVLNGSCSFRACMMWPFNEMCWNFESSFLGLCSVHFTCDPALVTWLWTGLRCTWLSSPRGACTSRSKAERSTSRWFNYSQFTFRELQCVFHQKDSLSLGQSLGLGMFFCSQKEHDFWAALRSPELESTMNDVIKMERDLNE